MVLTESGVRITGFSMRNDERVGGYYLVRNIRVKKSRNVTRQIVCWAPTREKALAHRNRITNETNSPHATTYTVVKI